MISRVLWLIFTIGAVQAFLDDEKFLAFVSKNSTTSSPLTLNELYRQISLFENEPSFLFLQNVVRRLGFRRTFLNNSRYAAARQVRFNIVAHNPKIIKEVKFREPFEHSGSNMVSCVFNLIHRELMSHYNFTESLSLTFIQYWHVLERTNTLLRMFLDVSRTTLNSDALDFQTLLRVITILPESPPNIVNIIQKYGIVPASAYPRSMAVRDLSSWKLLIDLVKYHGSLVEIAWRHHDNNFGNLMSKLNRIRSEALTQVHHLLNVIFSPPPEMFDWSYHDTQDVHRKYKSMSPHTFYKQFVQKHLDLMEWVTLVSNPNLPFNHSYVLQHHRNLIEAKDSILMNVEMKFIKQAIDESIRDGQILILTYESPFYDEVFLDESSVSPILRNSICGGELNRRKVLPAGSYASRLITAMRVDTDGRVTHYRVDSQLKRTIAARDAGVMTVDFLERYTVSLFVNRKYLPEELRSLPVSSRKINPYNKLFI